MRVDGAVTIVAAPSWHTKEKKALYLCILMKIAPTFQPLVKDKAKMAFELPKT